MRFVVFLSNTSRIEGVRAQLLDEAQRRGIDGARESEACRGQRRQRAEQLRVAVAEFGEIVGKLVGHVGILIPP
jgi:hypothetical protein